jgi:hypothetical protein
VLVRGSLVVIVMGSALWVGGFLRPEELALLKRVARSRAASPRVASSADTTELAGEIVATDLPDPESERPRSDRATAPLSERNR